MNSSSQLHFLWKGLVQIWLDGISDKHPEIAYEGAIRTIEQQQSSLKLATLECAQRGEKLHHDVIQKIRENKQAHQDLHSLQTSSPYETTFVLSQKRSVLLSELRLLNAELEGLLIDANQLLDGVASLSRTRDLLISKQSVILPNITNLQLQNNLKEQLYKFDVSTTQQTLEDIIPKIKQTLTDINTQLSLH